MDIYKYPRTRHIEGSRLQLGDMADDKPIKDLAGQGLIVEEKLDGANSAVSFDLSGGLLLQSRGHYLTGGGRERHFALLKTWAAAHAHVLYPVLGHRFVMYGEWMYAKHTVFYDCLPHYFMEFDVLDRDNGKFLSTAARRSLLTGLPIMPAPLVYDGEITSVDHLNSMTRPTPYKSTGWRDVLTVAAKRSGSRPDMVDQQTEDSDLAEGLYLKLEDADHVQDRFKFVRADFMQAIEAADGHWQDRPILPNSLLMGSISLRRYWVWKGLTMRRPMKPTITHDDILSLVPVAPHWSVDWAAIWPMWPELATLDICPQDSIHHAEGDVGTHTRMVVDALVADPDWQNLPPDDQSTLFWAAVLHDVGKPAVTKQEDDGRISSRGHSRVGASIARQLLWHAGSPFSWREALCGIIAHHQLPFWLTERADPARLAIEASWRCRPDLLCLHAKADALGRMCRDQQAILESVSLAALTFQEADCLHQPFDFANDESRVAFFDLEDRDPHYAAHEDYKCTVTVMSGLPGAGKDTWVANHRPDHAVVSLDLISEELRVSPTDNQGQVIQAAHERAREHLRIGNDFVWNATNVTRQKRSKMLRLLRDYNARIEIVYIEVGPDQLRRQNRNRPDAVPDAIIDHLVQKLEPPEMWEAQKISIVSL